MDSNLWTLLIVAGLGFAVIGGLAMLSSNYTLGNIKAKTVGDGQHGELRQVFALLERNRIGHDHFRQRAFVDAVVGRARQHGMGDGGANALRPA